MKTKLSKMSAWALRAYKSLNKQYERCDNETGAECRGVYCHLAPHRAMVYLQRIIEEADA